MKQVKGGEKSETEWTAKIARTVAGRNKLEDTVVTADSVTAFSSAAGRVLKGAASHTKAVRAKMCFSQFLYRRPVKSQTVQTIPFMYKFPFALCSPSSVAKMTKIVPAMYKSRSRSRLQVMQIKSRIRKVRVCFSNCNLPPALFTAEWLGSFTCYCGNTEWTHSSMCL